MKIRLASGAEIVCEDAEELRVALQIVEKAGGQSFSEKDVCRQRQAGCRSAGALGSGQRFGQREEHHHQ